IEAFDRAIETPGLLSLVADDAVGSAPPELERHPGERDPARQLERASQRVKPWRAPWRTADLRAGEALQQQASAEPAEVAVAKPHVRRGVEGHGSGEQARVSSGQEQRLLPAHALAHRVDTPPVELEPGKRA